MKTWLKQRGRMLDPHCAKILKILMTAALMAGFFALGFSLRGIRAGKDTVFWRSIVTTPEPGSCALCGNGNGERYHAPCLVRLATIRDYAVSISEREGSDGLDVHVTGLLP